VNSPQLILASASPRRRELLHQIRVAHRCDPADIDEAVLPGEGAEEYVQRMAREKAAVVALRHSGVSCVILAADTSVVVDDVILGKPEDHADALAMLSRLTGGEHRVLTAVCLVDGHSEKTVLVETVVEFLSLGLEECEAYLATDEPWDKAGAYAIQGIAGAFVKGIRGSYSNVVGLPLAETWQLLKEAGVEGLGNLQGAED
jgi:nucleoside triphosphate pyrophosphatase